MLSRCIEQANLTVLRDRVIGSIREIVPLISPVIKHLVDLRITHEFFDEDIHLQSLKLWLPEKGMRILLAVVIGEELSC